MNIIEICLNINYAVAHNPIKTCCGKQPNRALSTRAELFTSGSGEVVSRKIEVSIHTAFGSQPLLPGASLCLCTFCWPSRLNIFVFCSYNWEYMMTPKVLKEDDDRKCWRRSRRSSRVGEEKGVASLKNLPQFVDARKAPFLLPQEGRAIHPRA